MRAQEIDGSTRLVFLLGYPVAHSVSPRMHNHAFAMLGLPYAYAPLETPPESLPLVVAALRSCRVAGANVTIPHKQSVLALCDRVSEESRLAGAANTLYFDDGGALCATTTDAFGFLRALACMRHDPQGGRIVILGNGGVARTLAVALATRRIPLSLMLAGRDGDRARAVARECSQASGFPVTGTTIGDSHFRKEMVRATLLVNGTSAGMHPAVDVLPCPPDLLHPGLAVFDTIYNPVETALLAAARRAGCVCSNGLTMLLFQGLTSQRYWTGVDVDAGLFDLDELQRVVTGAQEG